ncbi:MAG: InlB B-repeat-containing protein [Clostridia bacterium]|nr:InlB B-repeat-containing protein [Clostridia bacterium]
MNHPKRKQILLTAVCVLLLFSVFNQTVFAVSGDGTHIGHTGGGSAVSGAYLVPSSSVDHLVGYRFSWLTEGSGGVYSRKTALDVYYNGYNPNSDWGYHIKATVNGTTYRNLSKYEYKRWFDSISISREYYTSSSYYKYCNRTDIPIVLPADEDAMTEWGKQDDNINIILNKMSPGATVASMDSTDFVFIEPIYRVKIENTNYCITVTEMGLIGCVVCSKDSTGYEGVGFGSGWLTIRRYTNLNWPDALKTDDSHAGISAGTTLTSATTFENMVKKGYGLMVIWNRNPHHLLTVYYKTGTGDPSLKIGTGYKLLPDFTDYYSSYIRTASNGYFSQSVTYNNSLTLMNGSGSGFKMTRDYYEFSKWQKEGTYSYYTGGAVYKASELSYAAASGDAEITLEAVWTPKVYTITYDLNGGNIGGSTTNPTQKYTYETDVYIGNYTTGAKAYTVPTKANCDFSGWKYNGSTIGYWTKGSVYANRYNKGYQEHGNVTLTAQWTPKYTVTYDANGGTGAPGQQIKTHNVDLTLSSTKPTRKQYNFTGWNTKADGKGTAYSPGGLYTKNENVILYAQWQPDYQLSLQMIKPNAAYREGTDVISSFYLINGGTYDVTQKDKISVVFKVYKGSSVIKTVTLSEVVVPGKDKNLIYLKWTVPSSLGGSKLYISAEIAETGKANYGLIKNEYASCPYTVFATPDTQYEAAVPTGFKAPSVPSASNTAKQWTQWVYESGAYKKVTYGIGISDAAVTVTPDASANATKKSGVWIMKSGYGIGISIVNGTKTVSGCATPASSAYTNAQYTVATFPEFKYQQTANNCRTLQLVSGQWMFRQNGTYGKLHFTPLWYPDGSYTVHILQSDMWTPAGMISRAANSNAVTISGSAYDDWSI